MKISRWFISLVILFSGAGLAFAFLSPLVTREQTRAEEMFRKGLIMYNSYQYDAATDLFRNSLRESPDFFAARRWLGQSLYFSGQVDEAINEWSLVLDQGAYDLPLRNHLQNLQSISLPQSSDWVYQSFLPQKRGFRYSYPVFIGRLSSQNLYFLSTGKEKGGSIIFLSPDGEFKKILRRVSGKLKMPMGAAEGNGELWITDYEADKIHRLKLSEGFSFLPGEKPIPVQLRGPSGICHRDGEFFIADSGNNRVIRVNPEGEVLQEIRQTVEGYSLHQPFGIACAPDKLLYVSIPSEGRILVFDAYGNYLYQLGDTVLKKPRHLYFDNAKEKLYIADEQAGLFIYDPQTEAIENPDILDEEGSFLRTYSTTTDSYGNLYVADFAAHQIKRFTPEEQLYNNLDVWVERISSTTFPSVGLFVTVRNEQGKYIRNLSPEHFLVRENDSETNWIRTDYLEQFQNQASVVVLLSRTASMAAYKDTLTWTSDFILKNLRENDKVRLDSYGNSYREDTPFTNSRLRIQQGFREEREGDYQEDNPRILGSAIYSAVSSLIPENGKKAVIWITAGNTENAFEQIAFNRLEDYARINHIPVFVINYENPDLLYAKETVEVLRRFSEATGGKYYRAFDGMENIWEEINETPETRYVINYESGGKKEWHNQYMDVEVLVRFQGRRGSERTGYFIP